MSGEGWGMDSFEQENYGKMLYLRIKSQKKNSYISSIVKPTNIWVLKKGKPKIKKTRCRETFLGVLEKNVTISIRKVFFSLRKMGKLKGSFVLDHTYMFLSMFVGWCCSSVVKKGYWSRVSHLVGGQEGEWDCEQ